MSSQFQDMRAQLESDEQLKILMAGLRGSNLNDSDYAEEGVNMVMVEVSFYRHYDAKEIQKPLQCKAQPLQLCTHGFADCWHLASGISAL